MNDITRCEHCGRILHQPFEEVDPLDIIEFAEDLGCDFCRDYQEEDWIDDERNHWL